MILFGLQWCVKKKWSNFKTFQWGIVHAFEFKRKNRILETYYHKVRVQKRCEKSFALLLERIFEFVLKEMLLFYKLIYHHLYFKPYLVQRSKLQSKQSNTFWSLYKYCLLSGWFCPYEYMRYMKKSQWQFKHRTSFICPCFRLPYVCDIFHVLKKSVGRKVHLLGRMVTNITI